MNDDVISCYIDSKTKLYYNTCRSKLRTWANSVERALVLFQREAYAAANKGEYGVRFHHPLYAKARFADGPALVATSGLHESTVEAFHEFRRILERDGFTLHKPDDSFQKYIWITWM
jgi:hypothetical protein